MQYLVPDVRYDWGPSKGIQIVDLCLTPVIKRTMILIEYGVVLYIIYYAVFMIVLRTILSIGHLSPVQPLSSEVP